MKKSSRPKINDLRRMRLKDGDIIVVKDAAVGHGTRNEFMSSFNKVINAHVLVVFVKNLSEIKRLDEAQMENAGWVPASWKDAALALQENRDRNRETD